MPDLSFMQAKFSIKTLIDNYLEDVKNLRNQVKSPSDEGKLQTYYHAVNTFKNVSAQDIVQLVMSFRGNLPPKPAAMRNAFPVILGEKILAPSNFDIAYLQLLLAYATAFKSNRLNIKEWFLRFLLKSQFSPFYAMVEREINNVITITQRRISLYQTQVTL